jgi:AcrR family transcriptional regulator
MARDISTFARARVLDAAEKLFSERGYAAVTLRDIAQAVGLNHASLYHHVPGGKEELYVEVMQRGLKRHHEGLETAIAGAGDDWRTQLRPAAGWLVSQPPMDITRMRLSDMPALGAENAAHMNRDVYLLLLAPIERIFQRAQPGADMARTLLLTGMFLFMVEGVHSAPPFGTPLTHEQMADAMLDVMVNGLRSQVPVLSS